jgi:L-ascorbate metabolism protein UlaG (beta-lactamase superfamily)
VKKLGLCLSLLAGCAVGGRFKPAGEADAGVNIVWRGHACFTVEDSAHRVFLLDPFDETVGYPRFTVRADAALVTHDHFDHNAVPPGGTAEVLVSTGVNTVAGVEVTGIVSDHDDAGGRRNGKTRIYRWEMGGVSLAHLGDLGRADLTAEEKSLLTGVDVLFVPVGGRTTLDAVQARKVVTALRPGWVVPMHYGNRFVRFFTFDPVDEFLKGPWPVVRGENEAWTVRKRSLPAQTRIYVPPLPNE